MHALQTSQAFSISVAGPKLVKIVDERDVLFESLHRSSNYPGMATVSTGKINWPNKGVIENLYYSGIE
jgi:hypothetical protein